MPQIICNTFQATKVLFYPVFPSILKGQHSTILLFVHPSQCYQNSSCRQCLLLTFTIPEAAADFIQAMKHFHLQPRLLTKSGKSWPELVISPCSPCLPILFELLELRIPEARKLHHSTEGSVTNKNTVTNALMVPGWQRWICPRLTYYFETLSITNRFLPLF